MTDQFSQEYIAYILSDEAKGLQDAMGWAQRGGWILIEGKPELVTEVDDYVATYKAKNIWHGQEEYPKLPALHDLLQIIEGAGWEWEATQGRCQMSRTNTANRSDYKWHCVREPTMLAAAKLAVRAIES